MSRFGSRWTAAGLSVFSLFAILGGSECSNSMSSSLAMHDVTIVPNAQTMTTSAFSPDTFTVSLAGGGTVIWGNGDYTSGSYGTTGTTHTVTSNTAVWDSGDIGPAHIYSHTFTSVGTYDYHCTHHPNMVGTIVVAP